MQEKRILVVDDNPSIRLLMERIFTRAGCQVYLAANGQDALHQFYLCCPHLVILDVVMPVMDGWEICFLLRHLTNTPIIFVTALDKESDIVRGLDLGAVDYVAKPFSPQVLLARARAALRQASEAPKMQEPSHYNDGHLTVALEDRRVLVRGEPVKLTPTEFRLLVYLFRNAGHLLTAAQILETVWGPEYENSANYVHVYVRRLRQKLEPDPSNPTYLLTERGVGYRFEKQTHQG